MGRGRVGTDSPASPHPSGAGSAGQRPWRNTDFHSNEAFWHRLARLPSTFWGRLSRAETLEEHGLPQQRGFWRRLARLPSPFWGRLSRADTLEVPRPQKNDKVLTSGKLNGCPWTVSGEADTLEGRGLEKTTKCCRGDQRDLRKQSVKSAAWVGRPHPLWRRLARLPSPFWGRLSRADTLEGRGLEKTTKCFRGDQRDLRKQSVKSAAWVGRPPPLWRRLARLPSPFWGRLRRADTLEGRGLEKTTKCCRGDQRDLRKQSVKSAAWVGRPPPLWRRLARLPSPFWGRLSRAETLEERGLEKTTKCCRGDQRDLRKQSVKSAAWVGRPPSLWRRLARLPSPFWGRLSRAETLEEHGLPQQ
ncbi:hypothetical protein ROHU_028364 [Labeo rohita]|uniref:Uncharacterized protein n=1 Tax=Labeo rohita TaxID=84645 RepID=A0A498M6X5_LABRO|nr:hypothetical protein ROHU_028364 [Labeo rohita]